MSAVERTAWDPRKYNVARGTTVQDCLAHAIFWFDQLTLTDAERYKAALRADPEVAVAKVNKALLDAARWHLAWIDAENAGPDYGTQTRDTHPQGEQIWRAWWDGQLELCARTEAACRAGIDQLTANAEPTS